MDEKNIKSNIKNLEKLYVKHANITKENTILKLGFAIFCFYVIYKFCKLSRFSKRDYYPVHLFY